MTQRAPIARHRAEVTKTNSLAVIAKAVGSNAGGMGRQAAVIAAASGLVLTSGIAANAAEAPAQRDSSTNTSTLAVQKAGSVDVSTDSHVAISFERPAVKSEAAPVVAKPVAQPVVAVQDSKPAAPIAAPAAPVQAAVATPVANVTVQSAPAAPAVASGAGAKIVAAAYAQLGVHQDCTALVSNSLAAAGIFFHGWPAGYKSLGHAESAAEAQPGDVIYYDNAGAGMPHVAIYIGNGQAIHGGFDGGNTVVFSAYLGSGPQFIAIGH